MPLPTTYSWTLTIGGTGGTPGAGGGVSGSRVSGNGKTGIAVPFSADGRGRLAFVSGDAQLRKIIFLNLSDLESLNPFQADIGLGSDMIFAIANEALRADLKRRIQALFRRLELADRARLARPPAFETNSSRQEMTVEIEYINLEEDKPGTLSLKFSFINAMGEPSSSMVNSV